jgi:hypothetical protein
MTDSILCDPYVWESPTVLAQTNLLHSTTTTCLSEHVNHVFLLLVLLGLVGYLSIVVFKRSPVFYVALAIAMFIISPSLVAIYKNNSKKEEAFQNKESPEPNVDRIGSNYKPGNSLATYPTPRNPFMNVLIDEIKYNPGRPSAASVSDPNVKTSLDDFFRTEFARDPTDVFGRSQSQREFITMPSTSIPNDVDSYQNWLYRIPGKTCKEGGREACLPGTDGGALPWLNVDS